MIRKTCSVGLFLQIFSVEASGKEIRLAEKFGSPCSGSNLNTLFGTSPNSEFTKVSGTKGEGEITDHLDERLEVKKWVGNWSSGICEALPLENDQEELNACGYSDTNVILNLWQKPWSVYIDMNSTTESAHGITFSNPGPGKSGQIVKDNCNMNGCFSTFEVSDYDAVLCVDGKVRGFAPRVVTDGAKETLDALKKKYGDAETALRTSHRMTFKNRDEVVVLAFVGGVPRDNYFTSSSVLYVDKTLFNSFEENYKTWKAEQTKKGLRAVH